MRSRVLHQSARLAGGSLLRLQSDERLVELARAGHEPAFTALVHRHRGSLVRYCAQIVGAGRAEDAVQQTLISAHDALTRTSDVRHFRSWLYRIAHNTSLNVLRAVRDDVPLDAAGAAALAPGADVAAERAERLRETLAAVQALPERQRAALLLRELEGRSHEEIGAALGLSAGAARQQLMRARVAVRHAATALTPYPLLVRLVTSAPGADGVIGDAALGGGLTLAKLGTTLAAGTVMVGGAVGTHQVVTTHRDARPAAAHRSPAPTATATRRAVLLSGDSRSLVPARPAATDDRSGRHAASRHGSSRQGSHHGSGDRHRPTRQASSQSRDGSGGGPGPGDHQRTRGSRGPGSHDGRPARARESAREDPGHRGSGRSGTRSDDGAPAPASGESGPRRQGTEVRPSQDGSSGSSGSGSTGSTGSGSSGASGSSGSGSSDRPDRRPSG